MSRRKSGKQSRESRQSGKNSAQQKAQALAPRGQNGVIPEAQGANDIELAAEGLIAVAAGEKAAGGGEIPRPGGSVEPKSERAAKRRGRGKAHIRNLMKKL